MYLKGMDNSQHQFCYLEKGVRKVGSLGFVFLNCYRLMLDTRLTRLKMIYSIGTSSIIDRKTLLGMVPTLTRGDNRLVVLFLAIDGGCDQLQE